MGETSKEDGSGKEGAEEGPGVGPEIKVLSIPAGPSFLRRVLPRGPWERPSPFRMNSTQGEGTDPHLPGVESKHRERRESLAGCL